MDEENLTLMISELEQKIRQGHTSRTLHRIAVSIALVKSAQIENQLELPIDLKLGTVITEERRNQIYDKLLVDVEGL